ncbi:MAG: class I SAM-dependent methyltransferase, partial [bacterium]
LELASGFSSRGLSMSKEDKFNYVEIDLPSVIKEKEGIIKEIAKDEKFEIPENLHFEPGNVLDFESFARAARHFDRSKPLVVTNEGLLRYLTKEEKARVAQNIRKILKEFGGCWITSDISLRKIFSKENKVMNDHVKKISALTGKDIIGNRFETEKEARDFFEKLGFLIERHSFMEVYNDLSSPKKLRLSESQIKDVVEDAVVFVMKAI